MEELTGKVKFYRSDKNFGFITTEDHGDFYFNAKNIVAGHTVRDYDRVVFRVQNGENGPYANNVANVNTLKEQNEDYYSQSQYKRDISNKSHGNDKITCPCCQGHVVPVIIARNGIADKQICPLCTGTIKDNIDAMSRLQRLIRTLELILAFGLGSVIMKFLGN